MWRRWFIIELSDLQMGWGWGTIRHRCNINNISCQRRGVWLKHIIPALLSASFLSHWQRFRHQLVHISAAFASLISSPEGYEQRSLNVARILAVALQTLVINGVATKDGPRQNYDRKVEPPYILTAAATHVCRTNRNAAQKKKRRTNHMTLNAFQRLTLSSAILLAPSSACLKILWINSRRQFNSLMLRFWQSNQKFALVSEAHGVSRGKTFPNCSWTHLKRQIWYRLSGAVTSALWPPSPPRVLQQRLRLNPPPPLSRSSTCLHSRRSLRPRVISLHFIITPTAIALSCVIPGVRHRLLFTPSNTHLLGRNVSCVHVVAVRLTCSRLPAPINLPL